MALLLRNNEQKSLVKSEPNIVMHKELVQNRFELKLTGSLWKRRTVTGNREQSNVHTWVARDWVSNA